MSLFTDKAIKYIPRLQKDCGCKHIHACGIFGNLGTETGGFKYLQEISPLVKGSRGGYGWMQWTGPRRKQYEAFCNTNNLNPADDESNYRFLVHELKTTEAHSLQQLKKTTTLDAATETFMLLNLRPGIPHLDSRKRYAQLAYNATKSIGTTTKVTTTGALVGTAAGTTAVVKPEVMEQSWWVSHWPEALMIGGVVVALGLIGLYVYREYKRYKLTKAASELEATSESNK